MIQERQSQVTTASTNASTSSLKRDVSQLQTEAKKIQASLKKKKPTLKLETLNYVKKYRLLRQWIEDQSKQA
jgi:Ribonuclease G/E